MTNPVIYTNGYIYHNGQFIKGGFETENGIFTRIFDRDTQPEPIGAKTVDLQGAYVIPGLIDIHIHGAAGNDFSYDGREGLKHAAGYLTPRGITSFGPTLMTLPEEESLKAAEKVYLESQDGPGDGNARIVGLRMEGPFLSLMKAGAQNPEYMQTPNAALLQKIQQRSGGMLKIVDIAPEIEGALELIGKTSAEYKFSLGHTAATYEEAVKAFDAGAAHVTHLFNAMNPFHHRKPGLIGAAWDKENVTAEIIGDGIHIHESVLRTAFKQMKGRICLISDGLCCMGMEEGEYELTGQKIILKNGAAYLSDGTIAGAYSDLYSNMLNIISYGIPVKEAIDAVTRIPAGIIGEKNIGTIEEGKFADFIICDENLKRREVYIGGNPVR